jgi:hypothetical protein
MSLDRTGLLIIRAWVEQGSDKPLRARIRLTTDVAAGFERELTFADIKAVSVAVETWLGAVLADAKAGQSGVAVQPR